MKPAKAASCGIALDCTFSDVVAFVAVRAVSSEEEGEILGRTSTTIYLLTQFVSLKSFRLPAIGVVSNVLRQQSRAINVSAVLGAQI
jgi:hypothetical protein